VQPQVAERALVARLALPDQRQLVLAPGLDVAVQRVEHDVGLAAREPLVEGRVAVVQHLVPDWLRRYGNFEALTLRAIPEGRVVHPHVPLTTVQGPLALAQILETPLLNKLNYTTLIATKAARVSQAGRGRPLLEFGMRRGHERGVNAGARAALIGGADFTSNVGASAALNFPPKGTHAHSMVQLFMALGEGELGAFEAYADVYPDDCLLLVDTVDTLNSGLPNAIKVFEKLRQKGHKPVGIRLDSGDLAYLAVQAARMLDKAGFSRYRYRSLQSA
jgi:nicotinate phosphoribosyltransferase